MSTNEKHFLSYRSQSCPKLPSLSKSMENPLKISDFNKYDKTNLYKTSQVKTSELIEMPNKEYKVILPNYGGFIPGMKSENPFGKCFTKLAREQLLNFENAKVFHRRLKSQSYEPVSKEIGKFYENKIFSFKKFYEGKEVDYNLRNSGFSQNCVYKSPVGFIIPGIGGNRKITEYRYTFKKRPIG
ncbi:MAG: hypothetical protein MJ252_18885 [archaeon]|nr:hypothetical protein [archaeon]